MLFDVSKPTSFAKTGEFWLGLLALVLFYGHYLLLGQDSFWYANDYIELVVHVYKLLIEQHAVLQANDFPIRGMLDSLPRGSFPSEFFLKTWLFYLLPTFQAVLINKLLIHVIAYISAYYALHHMSKELLQGPTSIYALLWACIPFWPEAGIGLAFIPTVFLIFYRLLKGQSLSFMMVGLLFFYCFYSHLHLNGIFLAIGLSIYGLYDFIARKKVCWHYWLALGILTVVYCLFNYRLFDIYFFERDWFTPHRVEYSIHSFGRYHRNIGDKLNQLLFHGHVHAVLISPMIYSTVAGYLLVARLTQPLLSSYVFILKLFLGVSGLALFAAVLTYIPFVERIPLLVQMSSFSIERFYFLQYPMLMLACILVVDQLLHHAIFKKYAWVLLTSIFAYNYLILDDDAKNRFLKPLLGVGFHYPTYREFFAERQFEEIKLELETRGNHPTKVASVGIHPAVASYNGLVAIDGYTGNYSLAYKQQFFELIQQELGTDHWSNWLYWHFKGWGNKAYLFNQTHQDDFMRLKWFDRIPLHAPSYNYQKLYEMGCRFILSSDPILEVNELKLVRTFDHDASAWLVHLYEIQLLPTVHE